MAVELKLRGGSSAETATFTGSLREVTVDTSKKTLVVHDGVTQGGTPLATEAQVNQISDNIIQRSELETVSETANSALQKANTVEQSLEEHLLNLSELETDTLTASVDQLTTDLSTTNSTLSNLSTVVDNTNADLSSLNEQGIGIWDTNTTYPVNGIAKGSDGQLYLCVQENSSVDPTSGDESYWVLIPATALALTSYTDLLFESVSDMQSGLSALSYQEGMKLKVQGESDKFTNYIVVSTTSDVDLGGGLWAKKLDVDSDSLSNNITDTKELSPQYQKLVDESRIIAHQGFNQISKTNTMMAFSNALNYGAQEIEMDIQVTSDGELVCFHDATVDAETNGTGAISSLTLAQVRALQFTSLSGTFLEDDKIPTFADLLDFAKVNNIFLWAEIKEYRTDADIALIVTAIENADMVGNVCLISSLTSDIQEVRSLNADIAVGKVSSAFDQGVFDDLKALGNAWYHLNYTSIQADPTVPKTIKDGGVGLVTFTIGSQFNVRKTKQANSNAFTTDWTIGRFL